MCLWICTRATRESNNSPIANKFAAHTCLFIHGKTQYTQSYLNEGEKIWEGEKTDGSEAEEEA